MKFLAIPLILLMLTAGFINTAVAQLMDTTDSKLTGLSLFSGRSIHAEYVSTSSTLIGEEIDSITLQLRKVGQPTGQATIGIVNGQTFGTLEVSTLTSKFADFTFNSTGYTLKAGDMVGIQYNGGNSSNVVSVQRSQTDFDGANTYHKYFSSGKWTKQLTKDLYMKLSNTPELEVGSDKPIMIHFDDGRKSQFDVAKPILDQYGVKATFYIVCGRVGASDYMTWAQIEQLAAEGHDIQAHTMTHPHLPTLTDEQLYHEVFDCKEILAQHGITSNSFAVPFNDKDDRVIAQIATLYESAKSANGYAWKLDCGGTCEPDGKYKIWQWSHDYVMGKYPDTIFEKFVSVAESGNMPIITYHQINKLGGPTNALLDQELAYLTNNGFSFVTFDDLSYNGEMFVN